MRLTHFAIATLATLVLSSSLVAQQQSQPPRTQNLRPEAGQGQASRDQSQAANRDQSQAANRGQSQAKDLTFARSLAIANQEQVLISRFAQEKATNADVKEFAATLERDHQKSLEQLTTLYQQQQQQTGDDATNPGTSPRATRTDNQSPNRERGDNAINPGAGPRGAGTSNLSPTRERGDDATNPGTTPRATGTDNQSPNRERGDNAINPGAGPRGAGTSNISPTRERGDDATNSGTTPRATRTGDQSPNRERGDDATNSGAYSSSTVAGNQSSDVDFLQLQQEIAAQCLNDTQEWLSSKDGNEFDKCFVGMQFAKHANMHSTLTVLQRHTSGELQGLIDAELETNRKHMQAAASLMKTLADDDSSNATRR